MHACNVTLKSEPIKYEINISSHLKYLIRKIQSNIIITFYFQINAINLIFNLF